MTLIPWIGLDWTRLAQVDLLEERLDITVDRELRFADEGLDAVARTRYPLIIVSDVIAPNELQLPMDIRPDQYGRIGAYVIENIRESLNSDTPIIAAFYEVKGYTEKDMYLKAGATEIFPGRPSKMLIEQVQKYL